MLKSEIWTKAFRKRQVSWGLLLVVSIVSMTIQLFGNDDTEVPTYDYFPRWEEGELKGQMKFPRLKAECEHIKFMDPSLYGGEDEDDDDDEQYLDGVGYKVDPEIRNKLVTPEPYQKKLILLAVNELPELVCKAVGGIALYKSGDGSSTKAAYVHKLYPDIINIDVSQTEWRESFLMPTTETAYTNSFYRQLKVSYGNWPERLAIVIHEAGHCATFLLESQTKQTFQLEKIGKPWPIALQNRAKEIVEKAGLDDGFLKEWERTNDSFLERKLTEKHAGDSRMRDRKLPASRGFLTNYAQRNVVEDITETLSVFTINGSTILTGDYADEIKYSNAIVKIKANGEKEAPELQTPFNQRARYWSETKPIREWPNPCHAMRSIEEVGVPEEWSAVYTKIMFLIDAKFILKEHYDRCAGDNDNPNLRPNYDRIDNGWHRVDNKTGKHIKSYRSIQPGFPVSESEPQNFRIVGDGILETEDGNSYDADMILTFFAVKKPSLPRGLYKFGHGPFLVCLNNTIASIRFSSSNYVGFDFKVPKAPSSSFCATHGYVWVARATRDFVEAKMVVDKAVKRVGVLPIPEVPNIVVYIRWRRTMVRN